MVKQDKTLADLTENIELLPQSLINLKTEHALQLVAHERVQSAVNALDEILKNEGRVVLRPSGTEPMLRVMVEGTDPNQVQIYAEELSKQIGTIEQDLF